MGEEGSREAEGRLSLDRVSHIEDILRQSKRGFYWIGALSTLVLLAGLAIVGGGFWVSIRFQDNSLLSALGLGSGVVVGGGGLLGFFLAKPLDRLQNALANISLLDIAFSGYMEQCHVAERWLELRWNDGDAALEDLVAYQNYLSNAAQEALYCVYLYSQERDAMIRRATAELREARNLLREANEQEKRSSPQQIGENDEAAN